MEKLNFQSLMVQFGDLFTTQDRDNSLSSLIREGRQILLFNSAVWKYGPQRPRAASRYKHIKCRQIHTAKELDQSHVLIPFAISSAGNSRCLCLTAALQSACSLHLPSNFSVSSRQREYTCICCIYLFLAAPHITIWISQAHKYISKVLNKKSLYLTSGLHSLTKCLIKEVH